MSETIFKLYCQTKSLLKRAEEISRSGGAERMLMKDWEQAIAFFENSDPRYKDRYENIDRIQQTFTAEQIDFICYQIGDWYLEWKDRIIVDLDKGTHRLGFAKEELKTIICGE